MFVTGLVLAAGPSRRLGRPRQLLPYRGTTLLGVTMSAARACRFRQLLVTVSGSAEAIDDLVDLSGATVVHCGESVDGYGASVRAALPYVDPLAAGIVLLSGDQPGVVPWAVRDLVARAAMETVGVCRYENGLGFPMWLGRAVFDDLAAMHDDRAVWRLFEPPAADAFEVPVEGRIPVAVDTWDRLRELLDQDRDAS